MKISTALDHVDSGHIALPEFQRGYVWNRDQVRALFDSLFRCFTDAAEFKPCRAKEVLGETQTA
jgi:uncharacterized protein with ParB-like and HNH nuclease domain